MGYEYTHCRCISKDSVTVLNDKKEALGKSKSFLLEHSEALSSFIRSINVKTEIEKSYLFIGFRIFNFDPSLW
jgi:hypothetical protein